jgi:diaminopimelate decarboxylase
MEHFSYHNNRLFAEDASVADLAERFGTPLYIYSASTFVGRLDELRTAFA